ncbi:MAG: translation initiation factor IF-2, partial [Acidimicrobiia bacterium]|nr:translation initiation factor IF-2 [Acidimicrobiia bacterium]
MRVYELARELNLESKDVLARAKEIGIEVKTASSGLDDDAAELVKLSYKEDKPAKESVAEAAAEPEAKAKPADAPKSETSKATKTSKSKAADEEDEERSEFTPAVTELDVPSDITVVDFADAAGLGLRTVTKVLVEMGEMVTASSHISTDALELLAETFGMRLTVTQAEVAGPESETPAQPERPVFEDPEESLAPRPPVVTVMGHVDHGKTLLLDTIRATNVIEGEAGGITQHIGAYQVEKNGKRITFIDTPGHEAFTSMRARGAVVTDMVILVVAADDGVMPQTVEAINHAKAAGVPMIVAVNKMDLEAANPIRVRTQLTEHEVLVEELGGDVLDAEVSAQSGAGIDHLLELVELTAELAELKANPDAMASGIVVETELDKGRGPVATVIVQRGTLRPGDAIVAGEVSGRVRAMFDENGNQLQEAPPSTPVLIMGWDEVPTSGAFFQAVDSERTARGLAEDRLAELRSQELFVPDAEQRLEQLLDTLRTADHAELRLIIKADTHGSLEAIREAIAKIKREDGAVVIIHGAVGGINANDIVLAEASEALVIGFNVRPDSGARKAAQESGVEVRTYRVIYELLDEMEQILLGRLAPEQVEELLGV